MNWEALGAIAELLGAIGVIVTLLYLSRQISHNSRQLEGASTVAVHEYRRSMTEELCSNPKLLEAVVKSNVDWNAVSLEEQSLAVLWNTKEAGYWEMTYRLFKQGALDELVYRTQEKYYLMLFQAPGRRTWWNDNSILLGEDFYEEMTEKLNANTTSEKDFAAAHPYWNIEKANE